MCDGCLSGSEEGRNLWPFQMPLGMFSSDLCSFSSFVTLRGHLKKKAWDGRSPPAMVSGPDAGGHWSILLVLTKFRTVAF